MTSLLQRALIRLHSGAQRAGLLSTGPGRAVFEHAYGFYKAWIEAGAVEQLRTLAQPGSTVIDVGANIGFFTRRFARWVGPEGRVIALEPEAENFERLTLALTKDGVANRVDALLAAAGETDGTVWLRINPQHPGDHRLAQRGETHGQAVPMVRLDDLLAARGWPPVSLIKVDVQGAEERVLAGAARTLAISRPAWFVEVDDAHLRAMGSSAQALVERFTKHGYTARRITRKGITPPLSPAEVLADLPAGSYEDLLFTP